jgi:hypothetical protein
LAIALYRHTRVQCTDWTTMVISRGGSADFFVDGMVNRAALFKTIAVN